MPNGEEKKLNFVAKVYDPVTQTYRPLYIAPDATDVVQGDVFLTDDVDETKTAAEGMTAITPAGVKALANKIADDIEAANPYKTTSVGSTTVPIYLDTGVFKEITGVDASMIISGTIALERLPQGALERLVPVENKAARFELTKEQVQIGDVVQELDTTTMYVVVDENNLDNENGYKVFSAGLATLAEAANKLSKPVNINDVSFDGTKDITVYDNTKLPLTGGRLTGHLYGQYLVGTWLQTTAATNLGKAPERYPVLDPAGWLYYRTLAETQTDLDILKKSGDTTTGKLTIGKGMNFTSSDSIPSDKSPQYFITMDEFASGGTVKWATVGNAANALWPNLQPKVVTTKVNNSIQADRLGAISIPQNADLNTYLGSSASANEFYYCSGNSVAQTLKNCPVKDAFTMLLMSRGQGIWGQVTQVIFTYIDTDNRQIWWRNGYGAGNETYHWSNWDKIYPSNSGALTVAGTTLAASASLCAADASASTGQAINIASGSNQLIGTGTFKVPFGAYSVVVRAQVSNITNSTNIFQIVILAGSTIIKTVNIKPTYFTAANAWLPVGTGVNFGASAAADMVVQIKSLGSTGATAKIDSVTVMNSPVAVNMIG